MILHGGEEGGTEAAFLTFLVVALKTTGASHIWGPQNTSCTPYIQTKPVFPVKKSTQSTIGGHGPPALPWLRPYILA